MTNVVYLGSFSALDDYNDCFNTECHYARAFEANDCKVTCLEEPRPLPGESDPAFHARQLAFLDEVLTYRDGCDLLLYTRTRCLPDEAETVWRAFEEAGAITASVHLDLFHGLNREYELGCAMFRTGYVFTADGDHEKRWEQAGINHHWLRAGVVEDECYLGTPRPEFERDVIFVGSGGYPNYHSEWPHRNDLIDFLRDSYGDRFHKWGGPEERTIRGRDLNDLYASAKVVVGDSLALHGSRTKYSSDRIWETIGRGGFLIMPRLGVFQRDLPLLPTFAIGDFGELKMHVDYWLDHDDSRLALRDDLHADVKAHHTYTQRARTILETVGLR